MNKRVLVIGAGLSGLAAGIHLAEEGVHTEIFDLAPSPGGMCRAWSRNGYRFDGCIQWMAGTRIARPAFDLYREVGALTAETEVHYPDSLTIEVDGSTCAVPMEIGAFRTFLYAMAPDDHEAIGALCSDLEAMIRTDEALSGATGMQVLSDRLRHQILYRRTAGRTLTQYTAGFKSPAARTLLTRIAPEAFSAYTFLRLLSARLARDAGYPLGGSAGVVDRMSEKFKSLGGELHLGANVDEIAADGGQVRGIRAGGHLNESDAVIAACDARETLKHLLGGRYRHPQLEQLFKSAPLYEPISIISFGVCRQFSIPYAMTCECREGMNVAPDVRRYGFALRSFDFDPSAAPVGCSSVIAMFETPLDYWKKLRERNPGSYKLQKELLAELVASKIDRRFPGFKDAVEVVDVATPATYTRLTNIYKGSYEGFAPTPGVLRTRIPKTLPGLKHFCLCGQWTSPGGGIGAAIAGGKEAARRILREL